MSYLDLWLSKIFNMLIQWIMTINIVNNEVLPKGYVA